MKMKIDEKPFLSNGRHVVQVTEVEEEKVKTKTSLSSTVG